MDIESFLLNVVGIVDETADARSISFEVPADAPEKFVYKPGQFLTVAVPSDQTGIAARCYSLSSSPHDGGPLTVTVKRTVDGYASNWISDNLQVGDTLRALPPSGIFTPASLDADLLLFAGGSGVTPIMSITRTALSEGSGKIVVFYANRDEQSVIFAEEFTRLASENPDRLQVIHWLESVQGIPSPRADQGVRRAVPRVRRLRVRPGAVHEDGHDRAAGAGVPARAAAPGEVRLARRQPVRRHRGDAGGRARDRGRRRRRCRRRGVRRRGAPVRPGRSSSRSSSTASDHTFDDWDPKVKLLEFLESKGVKAPYSCREGECSACAIRLLEGEVRMLHNDVLDDEDLADGIRLGCQSLPATDTVRVTYS